MVKHEKFLNPAWQCIYVMYVIYLMTLIKFLFYMYARFVKKGIIVPI